MKRLNLFKYGLTALMMAFAMTLCYSCSSDDDEQNNNQEVNSPSNGESGTINGHDYVVLAGYKWATENVGEVNGVEAKAGPTAKYNGWGCYYYTQSNAIKAAASWGGTWTLPTRAQWQKLIDECYWEWADNYHDSRQAGYIVYKTKNDKDRGTKDKTDSGYSPNTDVHIFLPAAGISRGGGSDVRGQGGLGYYWSSDHGRYLNFPSGDRIIMHEFDPDRGVAVRPVAN